MGAYIIHFDDKPWQDLDDEQYYRCKEIPWFSTTKTTISRLTPYTEDSAYAHGYTEAESKYREIRDELEKQAYQRGYEEAYDTAYADAEGIYESGKRAMYQKGLKDAWECARKIAVMPDGKLEAIFGTSYLTEIFTDYSASECIEKIRAYEQEKEEIQVGDEVYVEKLKGKAVVMQAGKIMCCTFQNGDTFTPHMEDCKKTGRHFPEIAEVLQKMKETDNG